MTHLQFLDDLFNETNKTQVNLLLFAMLLDSSSKSLDCYFQSTSLHTKRHLYTKHALNLGLYGDRNQTYKHHHQIQLCILDNNKVERTISAKKKNLTSLPTLPLAKQLMQFLQKSSITSSTSGNSFSVYDSNAL